MQQQATYPYSPKKRCKILGFSLVELSITLVVLGIIAAAALTITTNRIAQHKSDELTATLNTIEEALLAYRKTTNRLPCPADATVAIGTADYGTAVGSADGSCTGANREAGNTVSGMVPVRALGLADKFIYDPWGRQITYAVDKRITAENAFDAPENSLTSSTVGSIRINDGSGAARTSNAVVALISYGQNGHGGFTAGGSIHNSNASNPDELENCDCTDAGVHDTYNNTYIQRNPAIDTRTAANNFDDIVRYKMRWHFRSKDEQIVLESVEADPAEVPDAMVARNGSPPVAFYKWNTTNSSFEQQPPPDELPAGDGRAAAISYSYLYYALGTNGGDYLTIYKLEDGTYTRLSTISDLPTGTVTGLSFSPDDTYLAVAATDGLHVYKRTGDDFSEAGTTINQQPGDTPNDVTFNGDGSYLAVAHDAGVAIYTNTAGTFTKEEVANTPAAFTSVNFIDIMGNKALLTSNADNGTEGFLYVNPNWVYQDLGLNGTDIATSTTYLAMHNAGTVSMMSITEGIDPAPLNENATDMAFSGDSTVFGITQSDAPYVKFFKKSGDDFVIATSDALGTAGNAIRFKPIAVPEGGEVAVTSIEVPDSGSYTTGNSLTFSVTFNEDVDVTGTPCIQITIGAADKCAAYVSGTGTGELIFTYEVVDGDNDTDGIVFSTNDINLNGGTITSDAGTVSLDFTDYAGALGDEVLVGTSAPTITSIVPPANDTYTLGESLDFTVNWDKNVAITGLPSLQLTIGGSTVQAEYVAGESTATASKFRYVVATGNYDADGIAVASPIALDGGEFIKDASFDINADRTFDPIDTSGILVDTSPTSSGTAAGPNDAWYTTGEYLTFTITFNQPVTVTGTPKIQLLLGPDAGPHLVRDALYIPGDSTTTALVFRYTVQTGDDDDDGIRLTDSDSTTPPGTPSIMLNGGTIKNALNTDATLTYTAPVLTGVKIDTDPITPELAMMVNATPNFMTYGLDRNTDTLTQITTSSSPTYSSTSGVSFSHDNNYIHITNRIFKYNTIRFDLLDDTTITAVSSAFSHDSTYLAAGIIGAPYLTVYKRSDDSFTALSGGDGPQSSPGAGVYGIDFSYDSTYLAIATENYSGELQIYKRSGDTFTLLSGGNGPQSLPAGATATGQDVSFSFAATYLALTTHSGSAASESLTVYKRSGDTFTRLNGGNGIQPAPHTTNARHVKFSPNGTYLAATFFTTPFIVVYKRTGDVFNKLTAGNGPQSQPPNTGFGLGFSYDSNYLAVGSASTPYVTIYKRSGDTFTKIANPSTLPGAALSGLAFRSAPYSIVNIIPPADAVYKQSDTLDFTVYMSQTTTVNTAGGTPRIPLDIGGSTVYATYLSGSGSKALTFRYTVGAGLTDSEGIDMTSPLQLNSGTIMNSLNATPDLTFTPPNTSGITVDTTAPFIIATTGIAPPANDTYVSGENLVFTATFSEPVRLVSGGTLRLQLTVGSTPGTTYANCNLSTTLTTTTTCTYTVAASHLDTDGVQAISPMAATAGTVQDEAGNTANLTFTNGKCTGGSCTFANVKVDAVAPTISSVACTTANGTYEAGDSLAFRVTFSENVTVTGTPTLGIKLGATNSGAATKTINYTSGTGTTQLNFAFTIAAADGLESNGIYIPGPVAGTIKDAAGNQATPLTITPVTCSASLIIGGPTITSITANSADDTYLLGDTLSFNVTFSQSVTASTLKLPMRVDSASANSARGITVNACTPSTTSTSKTCTFTIANPGAVASVAEDNGAYDANGVQAVSPMTGTASNGTSNATLSFTPAPTTFSNINVDANYPDLLASVQGASNSFPLGVYTLNRNSGGGRMELTQIPNYDLSVPSSPPIGCGVDTSPNGAFVSWTACGSGGPYLFYRDTSSGVYRIKQVMSPFIAGTSNPFTTRFSPSSQFLSLGGNFTAGADSLWLYKFNNGTGTFSGYTNIAISGARPGGNGVAGPTGGGYGAGKNYAGGGGNHAWSPNGKFLMYGDNVGTAQAGAPYIRGFFVYPDATDTASTPYLLSTFVGVLNGGTFSGATPTARVLNLDFSINSLFLAVPINNAASPNNLVIYRVDTAKNTFTNVTSLSGAYPGTGPLTARWSPVTYTLAVTSSSSPYLSIYGVDPTTNIFYNITPASNLPTSPAYGVGWSADGRYLAVAEDSSPYVRVYKYTRSNSGANWVETFTYLTAPAVLAGDHIHSLAWGADASFKLAIARRTADEMRFYDMTNDGTAAAFSLTANAPTSTSNFTGGISTMLATPGNQYILVGGNSTSSNGPILNIYERDRAKGTYTKLSTPAGMPTDDITTDIAITTNIVAVSYSTNSPYISLFCTDGLDYSTKFAKVTAGGGGNGLAAAHPGTGVLSVSFFNDAVYLLTLNATSPYVRIYKKTSGTCANNSVIYTILSGTNGLRNTANSASFTPNAPAGNYQNIRTSPNNQYFAVTANTSPYFYVFERVGTTDQFAVKSNAAALPTAAAYALDWSSDGRFLAVGFNASPYMFVYTYDATDAVATANTFNKVTTGLSSNSLSAALPGRPIAISFSSDSRYLAAAHAGSPYVTVYAIDHKGNVLFEATTTTFTKVTANPTTLPSGETFGLTFSR